jgi:hypothetical protein
MEPSMTDHVAAYLESVSLSGTVDGTEARIDMEMPWTKGERLHLSIRRMVVETWHRVMAYVSEGDPIDGGSYPDADCIDLTVALSVLGLTRRIPREEFNDDWDCRDLLAESFQALHGLPPTPSEAEAIRGGLRSRLCAQGFETSRIIAPEALDLVEFATDLGFEATDFLNGDEPALAAACREFPMLASEILASKTVTANPDFDGDVTPHLLKGRLDRENGHARSPMRAMLPHVVEWLRGLRIATPEWDRHVFSRITDLANASQPDWLPRTRDGLEAFLRAAGSLSDRTYELVAYEDHDEEEVLRSVIGMARAAFARGDGWDEIASEWRLEG